jgi:hypothetical protein
MATVASIVAVVMGFSAALLLYEATVRDPSNTRRVDPRRRSRMRRAGMVAAIGAMIAAYLAAFSA